MMIESRTVELFPSDEPGAPLVVLNGEAGEGERVYRRVREGSRVDFSLAAISGLSWDDDLTPWPAPPVFKGGAPCGGQADRYLEQLTGRVLPAVKRALSGEPAYVALAGYSLAGLFAVYALYYTDAFARVASASGSLWYPGFPEFAEEHAFAGRPDSVYLSLGDKEARTRNPVMRPVEDNTRRMAALLAERSVRSTLEMNPGGHFNDPEGRIARAISWLLRDG